MIKQRYTASAPIILLSCFFVKEQGIESLHTLLEEEFRRPVSFKGIPLHADIRVGYADVSKPRQEPGQYLREAETALRAASERTHPWVVFGPELDSTSCQRKPGTAR